MVCDHAHRWRGLFGSWGALNPGSRPDRDSGLRPDRDSGLRPDRDSGLRPDRDSGLAPRPSTVSLPLFA
jgi:hypothetical protein